MIGSVVDHGVAQKVKKMKKINIKNAVKHAYQGVSQEVWNDQNFFLSLDETCADVEKFVKEGSDLLFELN